MKLPTVKLVHKSTGQRKIINATDYQRDIGAWKDWKILSNRRGDAPDEEVERAIRESDENKRRLTKPKEQRRRGDHARAADRNKIRRNVQTEVHPDERPHEQAAEAEEAATQTEVTDWRKLPWFKRKAYVKEITGTAPANMDEAEQLMASPK